MSESLPSSISLACVRKLLSLPDVVALVDTTKGAIGGGAPKIFQSRFPGVLAEDTSGLSVLVSQVAGKMLPFCSFKASLLEIEVWSDPERDTHTATLVYDQDEKALCLLSLIRESLTFTGSRSIAFVETWNSYQWWPSEEADGRLRVLSCEVFREPEEVKLIGDQKQGDGLVRYRMLLEVTHD